MDDVLTIGWSQAHAAERRSLYQKVLGFNMLLHLGIGLSCMFLPGLVSHTFQLPSPFPNIMGIIGRIWMATVWFFVGGGFFWFGAFDLFFAILLAWLFYRYCVAELMSRP